MFSKISPAISHIQTFSYKRIFHRTRLDLNIYTISWEILLCLLFKFNIRQRNKMSAVVQSVMVCNIETVSIWTYSFLFTVNLRGVWIATLAPRVIASRFTLIVKQSWTCCWRSRTQSMYFRTQSSYRRTNCSVGKLVENQFWEIWDWRNKRQKL